MKPSQLFSVCIGLLLLALPFGLQAKNSLLTDADLIRMHQAGTPDNHVISTIKKAGTVDFALDAADLAAMKKAGVSQKVALAAVEAEANQGDAQAENVLGVLYAVGKQVPKNPAKARSWLQKAASQGLAQASYNLGMLNAQGIGAAADFHRALALFQKASKQGYAPADFTLGMMYSSGIGVPWDDVKAADYFRKAAREGDPRAEFLLAQCYVSGTGVDQDFTKAYVWYSLAADRGLQAAAHDRDALAKHMMKSNVEKAKALAVQYVAKMMPGQTKEKLLPSRLPPKELKPKAG